MAPSNLDFNCALVTGGGGGIGRAISEYFLSQNKKVIICGRTESKLREAAQALGKNTSYYVLDTGNVSAIPAFVKKVTAEHPELDCLVNNAGVQRPLSVNDMDADEFLGKADQEIDINIRGPMHLSLSLLPHFRAKEGGAVIMNVSSVLGYAPTSIINPVYNGTKAWVHFFSMNLRSQLASSSDGGERIRVLEIVPPSVGTDLHRERADPDDNKKDKNPSALSVEEFMSDFKAGVEAGQDVVSAGPGKEIVKKWYGAFGEAYEKAEGKK